MTSTRPLLAALVLALLLSACAAPAIPAPTFTPLPTDTSTPEPTATHPPTETPAPTETATNTPEPTATLEPSPTATPDVLADARIYEAAKVTGGWISESSKGRVQFQYIITGYDSEVDIKLPDGSIFGRAKIVYLVRYLGADGMVRSARAVNLDFIDFDLGDGVNLNLWGQPIEVDWMVDAIDAGKKDGVYRVRGQLVLADLEAIQKLRSNSTTTRLSLLRDFGL